MKKKIRKMLDEMQSKNFFEVDENDSEEKIEKVYKIFKDSIDGRVGDEDPRMEEIYMLQDYGIDINSSQAEIAEAYEKYLKDHSPDELDEDDL